MTATDDHLALLERLAKLEAENAALKQPIHIVFDGPPGPETGRFGWESVFEGEWSQRADGYWLLTIRAARSAT